tara:strand:- start:816 stop:1025 length:210 start_codon:yes stop_codon:yes gene_type:complete
MKELEKKTLEDLEQERKRELINDLVAIGTVMEELWNYHPENPKKKDIVGEYTQLQKIQGDIENELAEIV